MLSWMDRCEVLFGRSGGMNLQRSFVDGFQNFLPLAHNVWL